MSLKQLWTYLRYWLTLTLHKFVVLSLYPAKLLFIFFVRESSAQLFLGWQVRCNHSCLAPLIRIYCPYVWLCFLLVYEWLSTRVNQSLRYDHSHHKLIIPIKMNTNNPSQKSVVFESSVKPSLGKHPT